MKKYTVVSKGGKVHVAWWWPQRSRCMGVESDTHWATLCGGHLGMEPVEGTVNCKSCLKALEQEYKRIQREMQLAEDEWTRPLRTIAEGAAVLDALDAMVDPETDLEFAERGQS